MEGLNENNVIGNTPGRSYLCPKTHLRTKKINPRESTPPVLGMAPIGQQATGLDAWASRVKCPARFVSHLHEICIYIYMSCL